MIDNNIFHNKKVAFHTLGCKLNFAETSAIGKKMTEEGFSKVKAGEQADVCVINTCSVTDTADRKCRQAISRLNRQHPNAIMVVTGCYAQLKPEEISKIEGVDLVLGSNEKFSILEYIRNLDTEKPAEIHTTKINQIKDFKPSCSRDDRTRYFLKVQDGCDYYCTYCTIPFARGRSRSANIAETVDKAMEAIDAGAKEIVLTGVNIGDFGVHTNETFFDLVKAFDNIDRDVRFRISSIEPNLLTDEIVDYVVTSKHIMPHFHIPLQSGTNEVQVLKTPLTINKRYRTFIKAHHDGLAKFTKSQPKDPDAKTFKVKSGEKEYFVKLINYRYSCTCTGYNFRGKCKHIDAVSAKLKG